MAWRYITYRFCLHLMLLLWVSAVLPGLTLSTSINSSKRVSWFGETNLKNTTTLLLSEDSNTLYVGARDSVVFLDVSQPGTLKLQNKVNLSPSEEEIADCTKKVDNPRLKCSNFIRILLQLNKTHYIICGTNAFKPTYMYFDPKTFTITRPGDGKRPNANGICPFDPYQKYTAMIVGGELYTGLMGNFQANLPVIRRSLVTERRKSLNIEMWLNGKSPYLKNLN
ncbi:semaphorin-4A-like [Erpetoichthys calabaricus]|uniref:semaphorin-4A-like n=1 Tax=Erpetoichthys calabaricus TaxID=27687 RepID=UPI002234B396|nr:semaphorin-4A-like [Erpetoichthys calabaricus]